MKAELTVGESKPGGDSGSSDEVIVQLIATREGDWRDASCNIITNS